MSEASKGYLAGDRVAERPDLLGRLWAMAAGVGLLAASRFARSRSRLEKVYLEEFGFGE